MVKTKTRKILLLPGDGIGPEVVGEVKKIIEWFNKHKSLDFSFEEELIGGAPIDKNKIQRFILVKPFYYFFYFPNNFRPNTIAWQ